MCSTAETIPAFYSTHPIHMIRDDANSTTSGKTHSHTQNWMPNRITYIHTQTISGNDYNDERKRRRSISSDDDCTTTTTVASRFDFGWMGLVICEWTRARPTLVKPSMPAVLYNESSGVFVFFLIFRGLPRVRYKWTRMLCWSSHKIPHERVSTTRYINSIYYIYIYIHWASQAASNIEICGM